MSKQFTTKFISLNVADAVEISTEKQVKVNHPVSKIVSRLVVNCKQAALREDDEHRLHFLSSNIIGSSEIMGHSTPNGVSRDFVRVFDRPINVDGTYDFELVDHTSTVITTAVATSFTIQMEFHE